MTDAPDETPLIEEVAGAFRPRDPRKLGVLPAWHDLSPVGREAAFDLSRNRHTRRFRVRQSKRCGRPQQ